ncbi:hypothetical protein ACMXYR_09030 [Neptuniibacter sp. QD29_5]|uniref:hypothetical protein n=1 Tax=Neptuniibacter sp. QD29_5 TaxID=3398207 RepID=UPI0039F60C6C
MTYKVFITTVTILMTSNCLAAAELVIGQTCPVIFQNEAIGSLILSKPWYHSSRSNAKYIASDNSTGIGIEIHLKSNFSGKVDGLNLADCDHFRLLQVRRTTAKLLPGEKHIQIDVPDQFSMPFYDRAPLEHGYGLHKTPVDDSDKPWQGRPYLDSAVALYDTPYVSDSWGIEGKDIEVQFETCAVCERESQFDTVLSCGHWGYRRDYMGGMTGWSEPEFTGFQCSKSPSPDFQKTLNLSNRIEYTYWIHWR